MPFAPSSLLLLVASEWRGAGPGVSGAAPQARHEGLPTEKALRSKDATRGSWLYY